MVGIKLKHKEHIVQSINIPDGNVGFSLFEGHILFSGYDRIDKKEFKWYESVLSQNDEVIIRIINMPETSIPMKERDSTKIKLEKFYWLKEYLTKEKLI